MSPLLNCIAQNPTYTHESQQLIAPEQKALSAITAQSGTLLFGAECAITAQCGTL